MRRWQLQEAKARLSEVVKLAMEEGPQDITVRGEPAAVLVSRADFERMKRPSRSSLVEFMRASPLRGVTLDTRRVQTRTRDVRL